MTIPSRLARASLVLLALTALARPTGAWGADGVVEINRACVAVGCFPGDDPGFPVTITGAAGRSYRLTSDLASFSPNAIAILITGSNVSLDLGGFQIGGRRTCSGACPATPGFQIGVRATGDAAEVRNGSVVGFDAVGVELASRGIVRNVRAGNNGSDGIRVEDGGQVHDSVAFDNDADGIETRSGCLVSGNTVLGNGGDGIDVSAGTLVVGNVMRDNGGFGLRTTFNPNSGYTQNTITGNDAGTVIGGIPLGANSCNLSPTCP